MGICVETCNGGTQVKLLNIIIKTMICHLTGLSGDVQGIFFNCESLVDHLTLK